MREVREGEEGSRNDNEAAWRLTVGWSLVADTVQVCFPHKTSPTKNIHRKSRVAIQQYVSFYDLTNLNSYLCRGVGHMPFTYNGLCVYLTSPRPLWKLTGLLE